MSAIGDSVIDNGSGQVSSMRIGMYIALVVGAIVTLSGAVGFFIGLEDSLQMVVVGEGVMALALGAKAWQKQTEVRLAFGKNVTETSTDSRSESEATTRTEKVEGK